MEISKDNINEWHDGILEIVSAIRGSGLVIYGVGEYGKLTYDIFRLWGLAPLCFADDTDVYHINSVSLHTDIPILPLDEAARLYPDAVFIRADNHQYTKIPGLNEIVDTKTENLIRLGVCGKYTRFQPLRYKFLVLYAEKMGVGNFDDIIKMLEEVCIKEDQFDRNKINSVVFHSFVNVSGSLMFAQLCDGHPQLLNLPLILETSDRFECILAQVYLFRLRNLKGIPLVIEIMAQLAFLVKDCEKIDWFLDAEGNSVTENIQLPSVSLFNALYAQIKINSNLSFGDIFKSIFCAYANASGRVYNPNIKYYIFYHLHIWGFRGLYWRKFFEEVYYIDTIREPVRSTFSYIKTIASLCNNGTQYTKKSVNNTVLSDSLYWLNRHHDGFYHFLRLCDLDECEEGYIDIPTGLSVESSLKEKIDYLIDSTLNLITNCNIYFIKFEDLKQKLEETMRSLCKTLNIAFDPIMLETTANGNKIYESTKYTSNDIRTSPIDQNDMASMQSCDYSQYMNEYDVERTKIIFKEVANDFGYGEYPVKSLSQLSDDEKLALLQTPYKLQIDLAPENENLTGVLNGNNISSACVVTSIVRQLREKGKNYLIYPQN